jgi:FkbM family methyltransferase
MTLFADILRRIRNLGGLSESGRSGLDDSAPPAADPSTMQDLLERLASHGFEPKGILDIGAYNGSWAELARKAFPSASLFLVEAQPDPEPGLAAAMERLGKNVEYRICLLGPGSQENVPFNVMETPFGSTGSSLYSERSDHDRRQVELSMHALDDILGDRRGSFELLKLDVQGAELDVLRGAEKTLAEARCVIIEACFLPYNEGRPLVGDIINYLTERGFVLRDLADLRRGKGGVPWEADLAFLRPDAPFWPSKVW